MKAAIAITQIPYSFETWAIGIHLYSFVTSLSLFGDVPPRQVATDGHCLRNYCLSAQAVSTKEHTPVSQPTARPWTGPAGTRATAAAAAATVAAAVLTVPTAHALIEAAADHAATAQFSSVPISSGEADISPVVHHTVPVALAVPMDMSMPISMSMPGSGSVPGSAALPGFRSQASAAAAPAFVPMPRVSPEAAGSGSGHAPGHGAGGGVAIAGALREADTSGPIQRLLAGSAPATGQPHKIVEMLTPPVVPAAPAAPASAAGTAGSAGLAIPALPSKATAAMNAAMGVRGTPYRWGGTGRGGFDCSGLAQWAYRKAGITLPRSSRAQSGVGTPVSRSDLRPGDLVFFYRPVSHVGIYIGNGNVVHAPETGDVVKVSPISRMPFSGARRL